MRKIIASFSYAINGIQYFLQTETNGKIHACAAVIVVSLAHYLNCSAYEWLAILLSIGGVFSAEMLNTALEKLCDFLYPEKHTAIKAVKDIAAGAVLVCALLSIIIGMVIFIPKF